MANTRKKAEPLATEAKPARKAPAKAASTAAAEEKAPVKRTRKTAPKVTLYVQYQGRQISQEEAVEAVKAAWTGEPIKILDLYVKPEDGAVYYVVNGGESGKLPF